MIFETHIKSRAIVLIVGIVLAWCAVWSGGEYRELSAPLFLTTVLGIIFAITSGFLLVIFGKEFFKEGNLCIDTVVDTFMASLCAIFIGFIFGAIVAPFRSGAGFEVWVTWWDFLLFIGFLPLFSATKNIIDAISISITMKS